MFKKFLLTTTFILIFFSLNQFLAAQTTGLLTGKVVDAETGESLPGVNVLIEGTTRGSATDLEGVYKVDKVQAGNYNLIATYMGYTRVRIENVQIKPNATEKINFSMRMETLAGQEVVVTAKAVKNTEASLLKDRQKSRAVSDAISAEAISQSGSSNAADAMKQVTGASVVGGKYVYVRGLGDRYTSTQLNGAEIPSTDPYKRSGSIDLIPSNLIDNIVTLKSFTPDKPGNFSGGTVDIITKDFPDRLMFSFSASSSYNSNANLNNSTLSYSGGKTDWLGMDDGSRKIDNLLSNRNIVIPTVAAAGQNLETAKTLDSYSKAFSTVIRPEQQSLPLNQNYSLSIGNQFGIMGKPFGYLLSLSYNHSVSSYDEGEFNRWGLGSQQSPALANHMSLTDTRTTDEVLWGSLLKASYKFTPDNKISFNGMYNRNGENTSRMLEGSFPYDLSEMDVYQSSVIHYNERTLSSFQLNGDHQLGSVFNSKFNWKASYGNSKQDEPDNRYMSSYYRQMDDGTVRYGIKDNVPPSRYYRYMDENRQEYTLDWAVPFPVWSGRSGNLKLGGLYSYNERDYSERLFKFSQDPGYAYDGNVDNFLSNSNVGLQDSLVRVINGQTYKRYLFDLYVIETHVPASTYNATQEVSAEFFMLDLPLTQKLRFVGGARFETTHMHVATQDPSKGKGKLNTTDILPSMNMIYAVTDNMNIRMAFGRTLARPTFREVAPYATFDFMGGDTFIGNPNLQRTLIDNYDLRWEWFSRPGEIYAISGFWKNFENPIEQVIINNNHEIMWKNVPEARVYGVELELRKRLDIITPKLESFVLGSNISLVDSRVDISPEEYLMIKQTRPEAEQTRPLEGQSPYIFNINLTYENMQKGIISSLYYNIFGPRLSEVSLGGTPDVFEQSAAMLNYSLTWNFAKNLDFNFGAKNLLDQDMTKTIEYKNVDYIYTRYHLGRTFSMGIGYKL